MLTAAPAPTPTAPDDESTTSTTSTTSAAPPTTAPTTTAPTTTILRISFEEWQQATQAVCQAYEPRIAEIVDRLGEPRTIGELVVFLDTLRPVNDPYIDAFLAVGVPSNRSDRVARAHALLLDQRFVEQQMREAAGRSDDYGLEAAAQRLSAQNAELGALLVELELPACVSM